MAFFAVVFPSLRALLAVENDLEFRAIGVCKSPMAQENFSKPRIITFNIISAFFIPFATTLV